MERLLVWAWKNIRFLRRLLIWLIFTLLILAVAGFVFWDKGNPYKSAYLPGPSSDGHYQFEQSCEQCHEPFKGVTTERCMQCHETELKVANDSHRAKVFRDPRHAADLEKINAMACVTCHGEHNLAQVTELGVTLPKDFCIHCHENVAEDRVFHKDLAFDGCRQCHNYHDNRALHEDYLEKNLGQADILENPMVLLRTAPTKNMFPLLSTDLDWAESSNAKITYDWSKTQHAKSSINCSDCHYDSKSGVWHEKTNLENCRRCHARQAKGFLAGKHGIRNSIKGLTPMTPIQARQKMNGELAHKKLACTSCHKDHVFNTNKAAVEPCMQCHVDQHSQAYKRTSHYQLYLKEAAGQLPPGSGVSCATCHMPRMEYMDEGKVRVFVQHNQSDNLRPNQKMVRGVCQACHGLQFTLNALADPALIANNYGSAPTVVLESFDMVLNRTKRKQLSGD